MLSPPVVPPFAAKSAAVKVQSRNLSQAQQKHSPRLSVRNRPPSNFLADTLRVPIQLRAHDTEPAAVRAQVSSPRAIWLVTIRHHLTQNAEIICQHRWRSIEPD
jgi:hypothetical protein